MSDLSEHRARVWLLGLPRGRSVVGLWGISARNRVECCVWRAEIVLGTAAVARIASVAAADGLDFVDVVVEGGGAVERVEHAGSV
jgi:hypothetical protein